MRPRVVSGRAFAKLNTLDMLWVERKIEDGGTVEVPRRLPRPL